MPRIVWDKPGQRRYETGLDHGVLYHQNSQGVYDKGYVWNGLTAVNETPTGGESNKQYADNIPYLNLMSKEEFEATIEAFTYPDQFEENDGTVKLAAGVRIGQQRRKPFGFSYRTLVGNDLLGEDAGYKLNLVYGGQASPSEKNRTTINETPEATPFSWDLTTTPVPVTGHRPTSKITIDSTDPDVDPADLAALEDILYGTPGTDPRLPLPDEVAAIMGGAVLATPTAPTFDTGTDTITIPVVTGVVYTINGEAVTGAVIITAPTVVVAHPAVGYRFPAVIDDDWLFTP